jgi:uncharacterized tellurite resistance protein B-like protein
MNKVNIFQISLLVSILLYFKDKGIKGKGKNIEKLFNKGVLDKAIFETVRKQEYFQEILDKNSIWNSCKEIYLSSVIENSFSEMSLFNILKDMAKTTNEEQKREIVNCIIQIAFADHKISDKEKETLAQVTTQIDIPKEYMNAKIQALVQCKISIFAINLIYDIVVLKKRRTTWHHDTE